MLHKGLLAKITINNYIRRVKLSESQRAKYYEWDDVTIKCGSKKLLQKYINKDYKRDIIINDGNIKPQWLADGYAIIGFKDKHRYCRVFDEKYIAKIGKDTWTEKQLALETKFILCQVINEEFARVIANHTQAGTPKYHIINGQAFYNQTLNQFARVKVMEEIKRMYYNKFKTIPSMDVFRLRHKLQKEAPLYIELEIKDTIKSVYDNTKEGYGRRWDVGNRAEPYMKGFLDFICNDYLIDNTDVVMEALLEDDDRLHISSGNNAYFTPISEHETSQLIFYIYKDTRTIWITIRKLWENLKR